MRIIIIDDHSLFAEGLKKIIKDWFKDAKIQHFQSLKSFDEANILSENVDLFISDIELPGEDVFPFFKEYSHIPILVISMHNKLHVVKKCQELGVKGYILKDDHDKIKTAIDALLNKGSYYSPKVKSKLKLLDINENVLTPKEETIIKLIAAGKSNQDIADELFISLNTIKTHRKNINSKLSINSTGELVKYFYENYISQ